MAQQIYFFILLIEFLIIKDFNNIDTKEFYRIVTISLFLLMLKPFMIFVLLIPIILLLTTKNKLKLIKYKKNIFFIFLISLVLKKYFY